MNSAAKGKKKDKQAKVTSSLKGFLYQITQKIGQLTKIKLHKHSENQAKLKPQDKSQPHGRKEQI